MRAAMARSMAEACGGGLRIYPVGLCPMAHFDVAGSGPAAAAAAAEFRRIFFYKAQYLSGELELEPKLAKDYVSSDLACLCCSLRAPWDEGERLRDGKVKERTTGPWK